jgi:AraC family transcriptional regulator
MPSLERFGGLKFPNAGLLASSGELAWTGIAAELRAHPAGEIPAICPNHMEITLAVDGVAGGAVERRGNGRFQRTPVRGGTLWFCPIGVREDSIRITAPLPRILHVYLPKDQFARISQNTSRPVMPDEIFYLADVDDELVRQIGYRILRELADNDGGSLLVEHLAMSLMLHLSAAYSSNGTSIARHPPPGALDKRRLSRVVDHIEANLGRDLTLADLARVACLSPHHFARAFRDATGVPPHRFVTGRRLLLAQRLLADPSMTLSQVAFACRFASQSTFTRAFQRQVGTTPGEFRKTRGRTVIQSG